jgi:peroxiredoxin
MKSMTKNVVSTGDVIAHHDLRVVVGDNVSIPSSGELIHLQFRRFAGCMVCNLHLKSIVDRYPEIALAGIREVVVFHSTTDEIRKHEAHLPFSVIGDPYKRLYRDFGVETSPRALLDPHVVQALPRALANVVSSVAGHRQPAPPAIPTGGELGLPADFLIDGDGRVLAVKYGIHAYDQWSVDELLALVASARKAG